METKFKATNLSALRKTVTVSGVSVVVDSLKFFNRMIMITLSIGSLEEALKFELTPLPLSLFDTKDFMIKSKKADLGKYLKELDLRSNREQVVSGTTVIDGGWLIHQIPFQSGEKFGEICLKYKALVGRLKGKNSAVIVFDGCSRASPKDHEH